MQRCKAAFNRDQRQSDALLPFSPLIKYQNVNFRLKKVARCKAKKVNNLNSIEKRCFLFWGANQHRGLVTEATKKKKKKKTKLANFGKISFSVYYFWLFFL